ncbi:hypothetical protein [Aliidongia dinghuensis]|uniref:hypothetical protein n=1 Tax=Aliidongia dinghuensis TaxID=1867774 RepID=UPI00166A5B97|nr:hypothetical protein [Aliidongia dinghuensis]
MVAVFLAGGVVMLALRPSSVVYTPPFRTHDDHPTAHHPAQAVPASWAQFAQLVQDQFKARLEADDPTADRFRQFLKTRVVEGSQSNALFIQVWVDAEGKVARLEFQPLQDRQADADLHAILERHAIGRPPSDMPQPVHVKLALDGGNDG